MSQAAESLRRAFEGHKALVGPLHQSTVSIWTNYTTMVFNIGKADVHIGGNRLGLRRVAEHVPDDLIGTAQDRCRVMHAAIVDGLVQHLERLRPEALEVQVLGEEELGEGQRSRRFLRHPIKPCGASQI